MPLKRALKSKKLEIQTFDPMYFFTTTGIKPEPIELRVKVVIIGDAYLYQLLGYYDEDLRKIFKVRADFDTAMDKDEQSILQFAEFIKMVSIEEGLKPFDRTAVAALVEQADPTLVLAPTTARFSRCLPGAAFRCDGRIETHITGIEIVEGTLQVQRWYYRQRMVARLSRAHRPWFLLIDSGVFEPWQGPAGSADVQAVEVTLGDERKWVYGFDEVEAAESHVGGSWDGVRGLLGGKGANLAEMTRVGVPVPPGFTVSTQACLAYLDADFGIAGEGGTVGHDEDGASPGGGRAGLEDPAPALAAIHPGPGRGRGRRARGRRRGPRMGHAGVALGVAVVVGADHAGPFAAPVARPALQVGRTAALAGGADGRAGLRAIHALGATTRVGVAGRARAQLGAAAGHAGDSDYV